MSLCRGFNSGHRVVAGLLVVLALFVYSKSSEHPTTDGIMASQRAEEVSPVPSLKVLLEQISTSSPPTMVITVTNTNMDPISILTYESALDRAALQLGLINITPFHADKPIDIARIAIRRVWPPTRDSLVTILPGESASNEIELNPMVVPPEDLGKRAKVLLKGTWQAVWPKCKEDISDSSLNDPIGSPDAFSGTFESNELEVSVD